MMGKGDKTQHNGVLIITDGRVIFYRKGLLGEVLETIPIKEITSLERKSMIGHRTIRMHTAHDQLEFKTFSKEKEIALVNAIEAGRELNSQHQLKSIPVQNDAIEDLKKLAELKDLGIVTEDEFNQRKKVLLARI